ncbi:MAG: leucine-rich repeat protein, partial [Clostridia bacterium]|nr:leucine-rich repeat protein [Clostridia bacterium]
KSYAFSNSKLTQVAIPSSIKEMGDYAFANSNLLRTVNFPNNLKSISSNAFINCSALSNVTIPESVTTIGSWAFNNCDALTKITIPASVSEIQSRAFEGCDSLKEVVFSARSDDQTIIIGKAAFNECKSLSKINLQDSNALSIGDYSFQYCEDLSYITIPETAAIIGYCAFDRCYSLSNLSISEGVLSIGDFAFQYCESLTTAVIPNSVTNIGIGSFSCCVSLINIDFGSIKTISVKAFAGCTGLKNLVIPEGVTSIESTAFSNCSGLITVTIPDSVTNIGGDAFGHCSKLTSIIIPDSVTNIGYSAFYGCNNIKKIYLSRNVVNIGQLAFSFTALTDVYYGGSNEAYRDDNITFGDFNDTLLNAEWHYGATGIPETYTLTYNANGGSGAPANQTGNGNITLSAVSPKRNDYTFLGWATISNAITAQYQPGATYNLIANSTLYAVWQKNETPGTDDVSKAKITAPTGTKEITWKYKAHITATATDLPKGYKVVWYEGETAVCENGDFTTDSLTANHTYTAKIVDGSGEIFSTSAQEKTVTIKVKTDFFSKLISFFAILFGGGLTDIK